MMIFLNWLKCFWLSITSTRCIRIIAGDSLPESLPERDLVLARDQGEDWCVGMKCPCGCGDAIELLLIREAKPRWDLTIDRLGRPSLFPSVWRRHGCHSHFWLRKGKVEWCK